MNIRIPRGNPLHYLRLYFNFCYYTLIIPYRFQYNPASSQYEIKTNRLQKVIQKSINHVFKNIAIPNS